MRHDRRFCALMVCSVLVSCGGYLRPPKPDQHVVFEAEASRFTSNNGFRFIVLPDENARVVRLDVRYHAGAMFDPPGKEGLAHLVEHMLFHTQIKTSDGAMSATQILTGTAQWWNAYTDLDSTHYMIQVAPEQLPTAFALEIARLRLGCTTWDEATFVREREIVRNEIRGHHLEAWGDVPRLLHEAVYVANHPYRRTTSGTDESIARITLQDACAFVARHYRPGNLTIVASGRTTEDEVKQLAAKSLDAFPPAPLSDPPKVPPATRGNGQTTTHELDIDEPVLVALFRLPAGGTRAGRLVDMAAGSIEGELAELAIGAEWGHSADVEVIGGARAPVLAVSVTMRRRDDVGAARSAIGTAMRKAVNYTKYIDDERSRTPIWLWYKENLIAAYESFYGRPILFADYEQFDDQELFLIGRLRELDIVQSEDIHDLGGEYLNPDRATYVLFVPRRGARGSGASTFSYRATGHDSSAWRFPVDVALADRPVPLPRTRAAELPVFEQRLGNGLRILMWPHGTAPMTYGRLVVDAGAADEPPAQLGLSYVAGGVVGYDTTQTASRELSVDMDIVVERLSTFLRHGASQNLDKWREYVSRSLSLRQATRRAEYETAIRAALYGADHPYGRGVMNPTTVKRIDGDDVASFERTYHTAGNATLILTGMFDPGLATKHAQYQFGHITSRKRDARRFPPLAARTAREVVTVHADAESPVLEVEVAFPAGDGIDRSFAARLVLEDVIGARLQALREGLAVTYGMQVSYTPRLGPGEWRISGQLDAARAAEGMAHLRLVLEELRNDPASWKGDFVIARRKLVDARLSAAASASLVVEQLAFVAAYDLPLDFHKKLVTQLAVVTPADLQRLIAEELTDERSVVGLFGPPAAVEQAAAALARPR
jgi:zinc protease